MPTSEVVIKVEGIEEAKKALEALHDLAKEAFNHYTAMRDAVIAAQYLAQKLKLTAEIVKGDHE